MIQSRYHIQLGNKRTTITMDTIISELLAIKLGVIPNSKEAHTKVREWLQSEISQKLGQGSENHRVSQWARRYAIEAIADNGLMGKVWEHRLTEDWE